ncbi:MAG: isoamylase early set domain-containing protein [Ichthyobacteriaceae bacterium]|nr:isoamylase early set domain-containing protein [Ichthyobacteriaceae bacterium]
MSLKKQYLKTKDLCKVTFSLNSKEVEGADKINVVGEFNNWDESEFSLKKNKSGNFKTSLNLEKGKKYQFKYLIDGKKWINDTKADMYVVNEFAEENSVVVTE